MGWILIKQYIVFLRRSQPMIIHFVHFILATKGMFCGCIVGTIIETIAFPSRTTELCPFNMIGQIASSLQIFNIDFLPIAATSANDIGHITPVMRKVYPL